MATIFFVSSLGDTDLAKATITKLIENKSQDAIFLVPVTQVAKDRVKDLTQSSAIKELSLADIVENPKILSSKEISSSELEKLSKFIENNKITRAYIGVPSPVDEQIPFQIAHSLQIPSVIAYEYMFSAPSSHLFWKYSQVLSEKKNCVFAVSLQSAKNQIQKENKETKVHVVGHLSIDRARIESKTDVKSIKNSLLVKENNELVFVSGTTQPVATDIKFLDALLKELSTGKYPQLQLRWGVHPGVNDMDTYFQELLKVCSNYPKVKPQFKIILSSQIKSKLRSSISSDFILEADVSGTDASHAASKIAQAVPGALLNEAAIKGKTAYFHEKSSIPYLPDSFFSANLEEFMNAKPKSTRSLEELELKDTAPNNMASLMLS